MNIEKQQDDAKRLEKMLFEREKYNEHWKSLREKRRTEERNKNLILYILQKTGGCSKDKLRLLIYLFDVEYYRRHGKTFTGWEWMYDEPIKDDD